MTYNTDVLRLAVRHGRTVEFNYAKGDGRTIESRALLPTALDDLAGLVSGHDPDRDAPRQYRLDRILGDVGLV